MKLTRMRKKKYLAECGNICPYCGSTDISSHSDFNTDDTSCWRNVSCKSCNRDWRDVYTLVDVEEI